MNQNFTSIRVLDRYFYIYTHPHVSGCYEVAQIPSVIPPLLRVLPREPILASAEDAFLLKAIALSRDAHSQ